MPSIVLANGVPPEAQLRGSYGGAKPKKEKKEKSKVEEKVLKAVEKKLKGGKNLSGMTDKRAEMKEGIVAKSGAGMSGGNKRADIVKKVMKEKGMKMIEASKYVKLHNLYKKA
jgi:ABC-type sugar transport system substrate-binding protein